MGNLYRTDILAKAGITDPPKTWDDYATAAKSVKDSTGSFISNLGATQAGQMVERPLIEALLARHGQNQLRAARALGINRNTLRKRLDLLGIDP